MSLPHECVIDHKYPRLEVGGFIFTAAMQVSSRAISARQKENKEGDPLWALPGGLEATEAVIRMLWAKPY